MIQTVCGEEAGADDFSAQVACKNLSLLAGMIILIHNLLADYHLSLSEEVSFHLNNYSSSDPEEEASAQQLKGLQK